MTAPEATPLETKQACLIVAAGSAINDYMDVVVRRYLKEHPDEIAHRLDLLDAMIAAVREQINVERAQGKWDGVTADPGRIEADHHEQVAMFLHHQCDCDWCIGGVLAEHEEPPYAQEIWDEVTAADRKRSERDELYTPLEVEGKFGIPADTAADWEASGAVPVSGERDGVPLFRVDDVFRLYASRNNPPGWPHIFA